jgi:hypothetical protein
MMYAVGALASRESHGEIRYAMPGSLGDVF